MFANSVIIIEEGHVALHLVPAALALQVGNSFQLFDYVFDARHFS